MLPWPYQELFNPNKYRCANDMVSPLVASRATACKKVIISSFCFPTPSETTSVHNINLGYSAFDKNCYFFIGLILWVLMADYAHTQLDEMIPGHTFKWKGKMKGNWGPFSIFNSDQFDPAPLRAKFAEKNNFESKICPPFLPLVGGLISNPFQVVSKEAR